MPSLFSPHVCIEPALTELNSPAGGLAWPQSKALTTPGSLGIPPSPQQAIVASAPTPHPCAPPALTEENAPSGGVAWPPALRPQQATLRSTFTPHVNH